MLTPHSPQKKEPTKGSLAEENSHFALVYAESPYAVLICA